MTSSGLRNIRGRSTIIIAAAAVIVLLFLPLIASINSTNALLNSQSVFAQQPEEEGIAFLSYQNPLNDIFMQYPSNWLASTSGLADYTDLVAFYSPLQNLSHTFRLLLLVQALFPLSY